MPGSLLRSRARPAARQHCPGGDPCPAPVTYPSQSLRPSRAAVREGVTNVSMLIIGKFQGDTDKLRRSLVEQAGEFEKWGAAGRAAGARHHRFGVGDGFVMVIDEWERVEQFQQFFANPE